MEKLFEHLDLGQLKVDLEGLEKIEVKDLGIEEIQDELDRVVNRFYDERLCGSICADAVDLDEEDLPEGVDPSRYAIIYGVGQGYLYRRQKVLEVLRECDFAQINEGEGDYIWDILEPALLEEGAKDEKE